MPRDVADLVDTEEGDYVAGVYEKLSDMMAEIQPSVDQIKLLSSSTDDSNADENAEKISQHLAKIASAGDSVSKQIQAESGLEVSTRLFVPM